MTRFDKYTIVFLLAFALSNVVWGVRHQQTIQEIETHHVQVKEVVDDLIISRDCWLDKYRAARFGWPDERTCEND